MNKLLHNIWASYLQIPKEWFKYKFKQQLGCSGFPFEIFVSVYELDLKRLYISSYFDDGFENFVTEYKNKLVEKTTLELIKRVENYYFDKYPNLNETDYFEGVSQPYQFLDLYPGNRAIAFRIFTERDIYLCEK